MLESSNRTHLKAKRLQLDNPLSRMIDFIWIYLSYSNVAYLRRKQILLGESLLEEANQLDYVDFAAENFHKPIP